MNIAVLGATSQIARDFVQTSIGAGKHTFSLFARRPDVVERWATDLGIADRVAIAAFDSFTSDRHYDAIINFVGAGNPAVTKSMGASILDITLEFDSLALGYLKVHPDTKYIFLSSGAVYGADFSKPVDQSTASRFNINHLQPQDWYGIAKFYAESRHRALAELSIVDIRVFGYFSHSQDLTAKFLISDILQAIESGQVLETGADNIVRDYIGPAELAALVNGVLDAATTNVAVDIYSSAPVDKFTLLKTMQDQFGLQWQIQPTSVGVNATGAKANYYSQSTRAAQVFGYSPKKTSMEIILEQIKKA